MPRAFGRKPIAKTGIIITPTWELRKNKFLQSVRDIGDRWFVLLTFSLLFFHGVIWFSNAWEEGRVGKFGRRQSRSLVGLWRETNPFRPMIMIGSDQGYVAATKAAMQNLKTALVNFNSDIGRYPRIGVNSIPLAYAKADLKLLGTRPDNILVSSLAGVSNSIGMDYGIFLKLWKGPYMDADPNDFMTDSWESKIKYEYHDGRLWLHSAGPDGEFQPIDQVAIDNYEGDDICMSVGKVKIDSKKAGAKS